MLLVGYLFGFIGLAALWWILSSEHDSASSVARVSWSAVLLLIVAVLSLTVAVVVGQFAELWARIPLAVSLNSSGCGVLLWAVQEVRRSLPDKLHALRQYVLTAAAVLGGLSIVLGWTLLWAVTPLLTIVAMAVFVVTCLLNVMRDHRTYYARGVLTEPARLSCRVRNADSVTPKLDAFHPAIEALVQVHFEHVESFYDINELIETQVTKRKRPLDVSALFEAAAFLLYVLKFKLDRSSQEDAVKRRLLQACWRQTTSRFSSLGNKASLDEVLQQRVKDYAALSKGYAPAYLFVGSVGYNPVANYMEAYRGAKQASRDQAPIALRGLLAQLELTRHRAVCLYYRTVESYFSVLDQVFEENTDFTTLPLDDTRERTRLGAKKGMERAERMETAMADKWTGAGAPPV